MSRLLKLTLLLLLLPATAQASSAGRERVVVMDIKSIQGVSEGTATILTDILVAEVSGLGVFEVVGSREISALVGLERQRQLLGCNDSGCLAEIGGALGAEYLLSGQVGKIGSRYHLSLTLSSTSQARAVARESRFCDPNDDALVAVAQEAVRSAFANLGVQSPQPVARQGGGARQGSTGSAPLAAASAGSDARNPAIAPGPTAVGQASPGRVLPWTVFGGGLAALAGGGAFA
jgi:TolB-like protein